MVGQLLGVAVLIAVVSLVFFTKDGRAWFEERCDEFDLFLLNVQQRRQERRRGEMTTAEQKRASWR